MEAKNINIIHINQMINSAIQQSSDGSSINIPTEEAEKVKEFLTSIDTNIDRLKIQHAFINNLGNSQRLAAKYFSDLIIELKSHVVKSQAELNKDKPWAYLFTTELEDMKPLKVRIIDFLIMVYECANDTKIIHEYFKSLLQVSFDEYENFQNKNFWGYIKTDHYRTIIYDVFLNISAYLAKNERIEELSSLINSSYQVKCITGSGSSDPHVEYKTVSFVYFNMPVISINDIYHRQHNNLIDWDRRNLYTETIHGLNNENKSVSFNDIINIDVLLYFISLFKYAEGKSTTVWVPHTSPMRKDNTSELMLKCTSQAFFSRVISIFGVIDVTSFNTILPKVLKLKQESDGAYEKYNLPESDFALYYQYINTQL
ncbi:MAG: hypothetical protein Q7W45_03775 [Bacteroidota bacterium]|nr:hypothetical protein [Bacteroidota bacterium]MDP3144564.1 hypothetical protein [Bacteroidota bacterium]